MKQLSPAELITPAKRQSLEFTSRMDRQHLKALGILIAAVIGLHLFCLNALAADPASAPQPAPSPASRPAKEMADVPAMRLDKTGQPSETFLAAHERFLKLKTKGPIDLLFIGDSITAGWPAVGKDIWRKYYSAYNPANFGFGGDRTQNVLWRIENGELDGISPKVVVLLIGVNNGGDPGVVAGVKKVVAEIHAKLPQAKLLLLGIFPRFHDPVNPPWAARARAFTAQVNKELATLDDGKQTRFLDIGDKFLDERGFIRKEVMPDGLHPSAAGYQIWADAMQPLLAEMLKEGK
ncbi:MAG: GDSL-type esterase/lipase family protein [Lentisphaeria bacterium]